MPKTDACFGLKTEQIEIEILHAGEFTRDQQLWVGLPIKTLLTPYDEIEDLLCKLSPPDGTTIVDLGAGYGRMGLVMGKEFPAVNYIGYEYVALRVNEGMRCLTLWNFKNAQLICADLSAPDVKPHAAEYYFLYDFGTRAAIEKCLEDLRGIARAHSITVVGRGRASRDAIERRHPWLSQVVSPEHYGNYSIYRSVSPSSSDRSSRPDA